MLTVDPPGTAPSRGPEVDFTRWPISLMLIGIGEFMSMLDITIVNVAVPAIQREFGGSLDDVLWIATAYTLVLGVCVPLSSWLGDRIGLTRLYIGALIGFALTSGLCGIAWNLDTLIFFRILQAIPGGIIPVVVLTMCYRLVPPKWTGVAMGVYGLGGVSAPAIGPVLGGYLVEYLDWRLVFLINVPIGLLAGVASIFVIFKIRPIAVPRFDYAGFITIALAMSALLLAASEGEDWGWDGYRIRMLLIGGALCLALFVVVELEVEHPLLDIRLLANKQFTYSVIVVGLNFVNLMVGVFYIPVFLQQGQGMAALDAGLLVLPMALVMCVTVPLSGILTPKLGPRLLGVVGMGLLVWGNSLTTGINPDMTHGEVILWTCVRAAGVGLATVPVMTTGLLAIPAMKTNQGSAVSNVVQQVGAAMGLAALGTFISAAHAQHFADRSALLGPDSALAQQALSRLGPTPTMSDTDFAAFYQAGVHLQLDTMASAFSDLFMIMTVVTALYTFVPLLMHKVPATAAPVEEPTSGPAATEPMAPVPPSGRASVPGGRTVREAERRADEGRPSVGEQLADV